MATLAVYGRTDFELTTKNQWDKLLDWCPTIANALDVESTALLANPDRAASGKTEAGAEP